MVLIDIAVRIRYERQIVNHSVAIRGDDMAALQFAADRASSLTGRKSLVLAPFATNIKGTW